MSTKIYNGLILRNTTLEQALTKLCTLRSGCVDMAKKSIAKLGARKLAFNADISANVTMLQKDRSCQTLSDLRTMFIEEKHKVLVDGIRSTDWDFTFNVCLIPWGQHTLGLYYVENDIGYRQSLIDVGFQDYHYQNSTDKPNDVTDSEWRQRELAWESVLPGWTRPIERGLSYSVVDWDDYQSAVHSKSLIQENIPSQSIRRKRVAVRLTELELTASFPTSSAFEIVEKTRELYPDRIDDVLLGDVTVVRF
ncbi:hypothetical protein [Vibrio vulnificus]|uniref:hypothetical protein n=1 Tax=Vibrio vulnificus TaxID=672 RepID=UPI001CDCA29C|nr:hypothetical protein [Vibrio vulnificus]MCA4005139.1 hypothetical protein [Vibrio vulnificus]